MRNNSLCILVDRSFFLKNLELILAHLTLTSSNNKLGSADFISTIVIPYCSAYLAELYEALTVFKLLEWLNYKYDIE